MDPEIFVRGGGPDKFFLYFTEGCSNSTYFSQESIGPLEGGPYKYF